MSLSTFVADRVIREELKAAFPKKPRFDLDVELAASPGSGRYSLVGTAFDYLVRFYAEHLNPFSETRRGWVASRGVTKLEDLGAPAKLLAWADQTISSALSLKKSFVATGEATRELLGVCLRLSLLDSVFRSGRYEEHWFVPPACGTEEDVDDLGRLFSLLPHQAWLVAGRRCLLNPIFGRASILIGGADCDLVVDDMLVDVKTTKKLCFTRGMFNQLLGYFMLQRIGGVGSVSSGVGEIRHLGVYFSRFGVLAHFPVKGFVACADS